MEAAVIALVSVVVNWTVNFIKDIVNKNVNGITTRITALISSFVMVVIYAHQTIPVLDSSFNISRLAWPIQVALAYALAASGGTITDVLRTFNRSDSSVQSTLL